MPVSAASRCWSALPSPRLVQHAAAGIGAGIAAAGALGWLTTQATAALATAVLGLGTSVILSLITEELLVGAIKLTLDRGRY
jgi:hypothetical protein